jgi:ankyrin repeat protein
MASSLTCGVWLLSLVVGAGDGGSPPEAPHVLDAGAAAVGGPPDPAVGPDEALEYAIEDGDLEAARRALAAGAVVKPITLEDGGVAGSPALELALASRRPGALDLARLVVEAGADVTACADDGVCPLEIAAQAGNEAVVTFLVERGALTPRSGPAALEAVVRAGGSVELLKLLVAKGAAPRPETLAAALTSGGLDRVRALAPGALEPEAATGLLLAAVTRPDALEAVTFALDKGADPNGTSEADAPLATALDRKQPKVAQLLLERGASPNAAGTRVGSTVLVGALLAKDLETVKLLLERGARPEGVDERGNTPLHLALTAGSLDLARQFIARGAPLNAVNAAGATPLVLAASGKHREIVDELLKRKVNPNASAGTLPSPLHSAAANGWSDTVSALLAAGADVNQAAARGQTPLFAAVELNNGEVARLLLAAGADPWAKNADGKTAMDVAAEKKFVGLERLLGDAAGKERPRNDRTTLPVSGLSFVPPAGKVTWAAQEERSSANERFDALLREGPAKPLVQVQVRLRASSATCAQYVEAVAALGGGEKAGRAPWLSKGWHGTALERKAKDGSGTARACAELPGLLLEATVSSDGALKGADATAVQALLTALLKGAAARPPAPRQSPMVLPLSGLALGAAGGTTEWTGARYAAGAVDADALVRVLPAKQRLALLVERDTAEACKAVAGGARGRPWLPASWSPTAEDPKTISGCTRVAEGSIAFRALAAPALEKGEALVLRQLLEGLGRAAGAGRQPLRRTAEGGVALQTSGVTLPARPADDPFLYTHGSSFGLFGWNWSRWDFITRPREAGWYELALAKSPDLDCERALNVVHVPLARERTKPPSWVPSRWHQGAVAGRTETGEVLQVFCLAHSGGVLLAVPRALGPLESSPAPAAFEELARLLPPPAPKPVAAANPVATGKASSRYVVGPDTVRDTVSLRTWQRGYVSPRGWEGASRYCRDLVLAGFSDWRLPSVYELEALAVWRTFPAHDAVAFPSMAAGYYWSSTPGTTRGSYRTVTFFDPSKARNRDTGVLNVRCVR